MRLVILLLILTNNHINLNTLNIYIQIESE